MMEPRTDRGFEPFVRLSIEHSKYLVKTADQVSELKEVLLLRGKTFFEEYQVNNNGNPFDIDRHDFQCDHLIIQERATGKMIGTYRILCSKFTQEFYSANEFDLTGFLSTPGIKLELGRACIDPDHRNGVVLNLLWRGVLQYAVQTNADYLFGCSSVKTESYRSSQNINEALKRENKWDDQWKITPKSEFQFSEADKHSTQLDSIEIPSLLKSYLNAGARVCGEPAYDRDFHCLDYLTVLKLDELKATFERRYKVRSCA